MSEEQTPKRPAKRKDPIKTSEAKNKTVTVSEDAFLQVGQCAKKLKMSKSKFASAAITFFAESGLDPTEERHQGLASVGAKVGEGVANVRAHNADIGNRLFALVRGFEKNLYGFLQQQQLSNGTHLELIESNILRHQVLVESELLVPMIEKLCKANFDALFGRIMSEHLYVEVMEMRSKPTRGWKVINEQNIADRDKHMVDDLREFMAKHSVPAPQPTARPAMTPVPPKSVVAPSTAPPPMAKS